MMYVQTWTCNIALTIVNITCPSLDMYFLYTIDMRWAINIVQTSRLTKIRAEFDGHLMIGQFEMASGV